MPYGYGILSVAPMHDMPPPDPIGNAINKATGMYDIFGKHYANQMQSMKNQEKAATLASSIESTNAKNQADTKYYPLQQDANLRHTNAQVNEVMARTGLDRAQAIEAIAHGNAYNAEAYKNRSEVDNPTGKDVALFNAYEKAAPGTPLKTYLGALMGKNMGGYAPTDPSGGMPQQTAASGGEQAPLPPQAVQGGVPGAPMPQATGSQQTAFSPSQMPQGYGGLTSNPLGASRYRTSNLGYLPLTGETVEAPTTEAMTRNQNRAAADQELKYMAPILKEGFDPYMNVGGSLNMLKDQTLVRVSPNSKAGQAAAKRLSAYTRANRLKREAANTISIQSSGRPAGVEAAREQEESSFGHLPGRWADFFTPTAIAQDSFNKYLTDQQNIANAAIREGRTGYIQPAPTPPAWAPTQTYHAGYFGPNGYVPPGPNPTVAAGFNGNPNLAPQQPVAPALAQTAAPSKAKATTTKTIGGNTYVKINGKWYHQ